MKSRQRGSGDPKRATHIIRGAEREPDDRPKERSRSYPKVIKKKSWSRQKWQLHQMDIDDLRQYLVENDDC